MGFLLNIKLLFFLGLETANLTIDKLKKQIQENVTGIQNRHQMGPDLVSIIGMYCSAARYTFYILKIIFKFYRTRRLSTFT